MNQDKDIQVLRKIESIMDDMLDRGETYFKVRHSNGHYSDEYLNLSLSIGYITKNSAVFKFKGKRFISAEFNHKDRWNEVNRLIERINRLYEEMQRLYNKKQSEKVKNKNENLTNEFLHGKLGLTMYKKEAV